MCFAFRAENCVFVVLAGKFVLRLLRGNAFLRLWRKIFFCGFSGKCIFVLMAGKYVFVVLAENMFLHLWRRNAFLCLWWENVFL